MCMCVYMHVHVLHVYECAVHVYVCMCSVTAYMCIPSEHMFRIQTIIWRYSSDLPPSGIKFRSVGLVSGAFPCQAMSLALPSTSTGPNCTYTKQSLLGKQFQNSVVSENTGTREWVGRTGSACHILCTELEVYRQVSHYRKLSVWPTLCEIQ